MATVVIFLERRYGLMTAYEELVTGISNIEADMSLIPQENRENRRGKTKHKSWNDTRYQRKRKNDKSYF
jgi:hypothetical protein